MSMMELKKMMIRMVVTKANSRDNLNCDLMTDIMMGMMTMRLMMVMAQP